MHTDRTGPSPTRAAADPLVHIDAKRVAGLGAPVSVSIRFDACALPALRETLSEQVHPVPELNPPRRKSTTGAPPDLVQARAWRDMLDQLDDADGEDRASVIVLWPTALALPALRSALSRALDTLAQSARDNDALPALAQTLAMTAELLATLQAVLAVDRGGLQDVAL